LKKTSSECFDRLTIKARVVKPERGASSINNRPVDSDILPFEERSEYAEYRSLFDLIDCGIGISANRTVQ
jgi:hypothetical protein